MIGQNEFGFCNEACPKHGSTGSPGSTGCKTVGGPKPYVPCIFPFKYEGVTYTSCPVDLEDPSKRWCSTKVDGYGNHVTGAGEYGYCGPDCPLLGKSKKLFETNIIQYLQTFRLKL